MEAAALRRMPGGITPGERPGSAGRKRRDVLRSGDASQDFVAVVRELKEVSMLRWAAAFFIIAIIAAVFGFGGIAAGSAEIARVLFFLFLVIFVVSLLWGLLAGRRSAPPGV